MKPIINIIKQSDSTLTELSLYLVSMFWGASLLLPEQSFFVSPIFKPLAHIASEALWGFIALMWGITGTFVLTKGFKFFYVRKLLTFTGSLYWIFISIFSFINAPFFTSFSIYFSYGSLCMLCFLKLPKSKTIKKY